MGEVKLLPCPFCGGNKIDGMFIRDGWRVGCMEFGGGVQAYHPEAHKRAAEKWNRRYLDAAKDAEIAKLREENERLREALAPFAAVAQHDIGEDEANVDLFKPISSPNNRAPLLRVGDFRRTLAALANEPTP